MNKNIFVEKAYAWMERIAVADSFTVSHAYIFDHVLDYLGELRGNEDKRKVAKSLTNIIESKAPTYLKEPTKTELLEIENNFQELVDEISK